MDNRPNPDPNNDWSEQIAAAFDWWREAGIDADFVDMPINWLASAKPAETPTPLAAAQTAPAAERQATPTATAVDLAGLPPDLAAFAAWWLTEPALDDGRIAGRVPPRGATGAELMIVVPEPEVTDTDHDRLLSGPQGRLLDSILAALGIAPADTYLASALPRHTPMANWPEVTVRGLGLVLLHHVALVQPRRLLILGATIPSLLYNDPAHKSAISETFNHEGLSIPMFTARSLQAMLDRPRWKAGLWQGLLGWTG